MLPGAVHLHPVNPCCGERLLIRNNWEGAAKSQSGRNDRYGRERRMIRPVCGSTSTQITRPF